MIDMPSGKLTIAAFHDEQAQKPVITYPPSPVCKHGRQLILGNCETRYPDGHTVLIGTHVMCPLCTHSQGVYRESPMEPPREISFWSAVASHIFG